MRLLRHGTSGESSNLANHRDAAPGASPADRGRDRQFPVSIETVVDEQLTVVSSPRKPGMHCQLLAPRGRAGSISVFGGQVARLACAHGAWFLKRSPASPRGVTIETADHKLAARYLRRRVLPGGVIWLVDGTEVALRRSRPGRWKVRSADGRSCLAEVRRSRRRSARGQELKVIVHSLPTNVQNASMIVLVACALLMLPGEID
jgi:hypothetical protein